MRVRLTDLDLGGHVKKGEKSTPVIYYKILEKLDEAGKAVVREDGSPLAFRSFGGRMFLISTRPKAYHRRTKGRLPSWKMPGFVQSTTPDSPPITRWRTTSSVSRRPPHSIARRIITTPFTMS
jgi:N-terminal domain of anti-restriction factor ArdC